VKAVKGFWTLTGSKVEDAKFLVAGLHWTAALKKGVRNSGFL